ncbi:hypothetical protein K438DRAFT_1869461 [Mycena galopus ATCC 62051]|nr:hypothetical protein K438DRAFT_1869461 [Mycena galopus ATCC 62051]
MWEAERLFLLITHSGFTGSPTGYLPRLLLSIPFSLFFDSAVSIMIVSCLTSRHRRRQLASKQQRLDLPKHTDFAAMSSRRLGVSIFPAIKITAFLDEQVIVAYPQSGR